MQGGLSRRLQRHPHQYRSHSDPFPDLRPSRRHRPKAPHPSSSGGGFGRSPAGDEGSRASAARVDAGGSRALSRRELAAAAAPRAGFTPPVAPASRASLPWVQGGPVRRASAAASGRASRRAGPVVAPTADDDIVVSLKASSIPRGGAYDFALLVTDAQATLQLSLDQTLRKRTAAIAPGSHCPPARPPWAPGYHPLRLVYARQSGRQPQIGAGSGRPPPASASLAENFTVRLGPGLRSSAPRRPPADRPATSASTTYDRPSSTKSFATNRRRFTLKPTTRPPPSASSARRYALD